MDTRFPKISVIIPSLNHGRFLEQCLESVIEQKYPNLELIVMDGGSTDETRAIIQRYARHLTYQVSEKDDGQSDAINKGFARASGDLVAWLNADDFYLPNGLQAVAETYRSQPGAPFYFGDGVRVNEAGTTRGGFFPNGRVAFIREALIFGLNYLLQPSVFINREALAKAGYLDPTLRYGMDTDLWIRLSAEKPPVPIPHQLAATREYRETKTATGSLGRIEELRLIAKKHSGCSATPGVLCYLFDTLDTLAAERPDLYSSKFRKHVKKLWAHAASLLSRYGADCNGFPDEAVRLSRGRRIARQLKGRLCFGLRRVKSAIRNDRRS